MQAFVDTLKTWHIHPVADHFTVALIVVGVLVDLFASIVPSRLWIRYMALTLMILGAGAAFLSNLTGGWEADRVWDSVTGPGKSVLETHAWWGDILPWVFLGAAVWRLGVQFVGFIAATRPIYLLAAVVVLGLVTYQGYKGGELVYDYGVGTALMETPTPEQSPAVPPVASTPIPTVSVPTPTATASPSPMATPSVSPMGSASPPDGGASPAASSGATPEPKNL